MSNYKRCHKIAAEMVGGGDEGLLNYRLFNKLSEIDDYCCRAGGALVSRQVIATIIHNWITNESEGQKVYGD